MLVSLTSLVPGGNLFAPGLAQTGERLLSVAHSAAARIGLFILICVIAPVVEEMIFRGFVYPGLRRRMSVAGAVVASALLFALMHNNPAALAPCPPGRKSKRKMVPPPTFACLNAGSIAPGGISTPGFLA